MGDGLLVEFGSVVRFGRGERRFPGTLARAESGCPIDRGRLMSSPSTNGG
jgi:hypothetical protein